MLTYEPMTTDAELVDAWRARDPDAGEALIERHYDAIVRFFRTKTDTGADDLVQKTFLVCAERIHTFEGVAPFRAFLFGIARNVLFEHLRSRMRDGRRPDLDLGSVSILDMAPGVSSLAAHRADQRVLVAALQRMPLELQLLIELYYWEELSIDELAHLLDLAPGTVKSRLHRARALLRDTMAKLPTTPLEAESVRVLLEGWAENVRVQHPSPLELEEDARAAAPRGDSR